LLTKEHKPVPQRIIVNLSSKGILVEYSELVQGGSRKVGMSTVEMIAWGALGLLSLILPFAWLLWGGTLADQKKDEALQVLEGRETRGPTS
jgi:hypothetical protein